MPSVNDLSASRLLAWPRRVWLGLAAALFLAVLVVRYGAFSEGSVSNLNAQNGSAILINWLIEAAMNLGFVGVWLLAAIGIGYRLISRWTRDVDSLLRFSTNAAVGIGAIGLIVLGLGLAGGLNQITGWAILAVGIGLLPWKQFGVIGPWLTQRSAGGVYWLLPAGIFAFMVCCASLPPFLLWKPLDPHPYDVVSYHLQIPREWFEAGRIVPLSHNAFSYFPMGQEMHSLLAMHLLGGPWAAMYAAQLFSVVFTALAMLAVVGAIRPNRGRAVAWLGGLLMLGIPWTMMLGSVAYVESAVMLYATLAVVWATRKLGVAELAIAGSCLGLAGGIKYTALAMTAVPLIVLWPMIYRREGRALLKPWLVMVLGCGLVVSPWLVRNAVWTGNPVFPLATSIFGHGPFTPEQIDRYTTAHAPPVAERPVGQRIKAAWHRVAMDPQFAFGLVPLAVIGLALAIRSDRSNQLIAAMLAATTLVWLLATHDMPRFLAPAIPLAALSVAAWPARRWATGVLALGVGATGMAGVIWTINAASADVENGRGGFFWLNDMTAIMSPDLKAVYDAGGKLALVGDAEAFFYPFPAGRLKYRGVFDVVIPSGASLTDGWLGEPVDQLRAEGWSVLIAPGELTRLSGTYAHLPKPPTPFDDPAGMPIVLPPTGMPR